MKPHVIIHMMTPLDGRLNVEKWQRPAGTKAEDQIDIYETLHDEMQPDAWMCGSSTMTEFATGKPHAPADFDTPPRPLFKAETDKKRFAVALDRHAALHWEGPTATDDHVVVLLATDVADKHLAELIEDKISYYVFDHKNFTITDALNVLAEHFAIKKLLLEGGGTLVGAALNEKVADEFSLVLCPIVCGISGEKTIIEAGEHGVTSKPALTLTSFKEVAPGVLWMRYKLD